MTGTPASRSAAAVPPVEMISQPSSTRPWAKATIPRLSLTEIRARGMGLHVGNAADGSMATGQSGPRRREHDRRQQPVLLLEHPRGEHLGGVAGEDRHPRLGQDRSAIVLLFHQVHGAAGLGGPALQHRLVHAAAVHALPAERGQQGGVHVDDPAAVARDDLGRHQLEVSGQHEQVHRLRLECVEPLVRAAPVREGQRRDTALAAPGRGPGHQRRSLSTRTTRASSPFPRRVKSASRLLPRPETATATRIGMAEEGNRRAPVRLADGGRPGVPAETCKLKRQKGLGDGASDGSTGWRHGIGTNVALLGSGQVT